MSGGTLRKGMTKQEMRGNMESKFGPDGTQEIIDKYVGPYTERRLVQGIRVGLVIITLVCAAAICAITNNENVSLNENASPTTLPSAE